MSEPRKPEHTYRIGRLSATIWKNEADERAFHTVEIVRNYRDQNGNWKTSSSFSHDELLNVARLSERAEKFIASQL